MSTSCKSFIHTSILYHDNPNKFLYADSSSVPPNPHIRSARAPPTFALRGDVQVLLGPTQLHPDSPRMPACAQMWFCDASAETRAAYHLTHNGLSEVRDAPLMVSHIQNLIARYHPWYQACLTTMERIADLDEPPEEISLRFSQADGRIRPLAGAYNRETGTEFSAILPGMLYGNGQMAQQFSVYMRAPTAGRTHLQTLTSMSEWCDPLCYPISFCTGLLGWTPGIPYRENTADHLTRRRAQVTMHEFYRYRMQVRDADNCIREDIIHRCFRVFDQYMCTSWARIQNKDLQYHVQNQDVVQGRANQGLASNEDMMPEGLDLLSSQRRDLHMGPEHVASDDASEEMPEDYVRVPSSFVGGARNMIQRYYDVCAVMNRYGIPTLFVTFTANPQWQEVKDEMFPGQHSNDRSEMVDRVFKMKLEQLLRQLNTDGIFGNVVAHTHVIEFQIRGEYMQQYATC
jgi:hypothetical protein